MFNRMRMAAASGGPTKLLFQPLSADTAPKDYSAYATPFSATTGGTPTFQTSGLWPGYGCVDYPVNVKHNVNLPMDADFSGDFVIDLAASYPTSPDGYFISPIGIGQPKMGGGAGANGILFFWQVYNTFSGGIVDVFRDGVLTLRIVQHIGGATLESLGWPPPGTINHIRIVRSGTDIACYRGGSQISAGVLAINDSPRNMGGQPSFIGCETNGPRTTRVYSARVLCGTDGGYGVGATTPVPTGPWSA